MGLCVYCELDRKLTREHVIPGWYLRLAEPGDNGVSFVQRIRDKGSSVQMVVRDVCGVCNNNPLGRLDDYMHQIYLAELSSPLYRGESRRASLDFDRLGKWLIKISFNIARANSSESEILKQYAKYTISDSPLPSGVRIFVQTIGPSVSDANQRLRIAKRGEDAISPKAMRGGRATFTVQATGQHWCFRRVTVDGFNFTIMLPSLLVGSVPDISELCRVLTSRNGGVEIHRDTSTMLPPPVIDALSFGMGHVLQFPLHYGLTDDPVLRYLVGNREDRILLPIFRDEVLEGNAFAIDLLKNASFNQELGEALAERVELCIDGYDDDPRELWEISEVMEFLRRIDKEFSAWMYFQAPEGQWMDFLFTCLIASKPLPGGVEIHADTMRDTMLRWFCSLNEVAERLGVTEARLKSISLRCASSLQRALRMV